VICFVGLTLASLRISYGQANIEMARSVFEELRRCEAQLFAAVIPCSAQKPPGFTEDEVFHEDEIGPLSRVCRLMTIALGVCERCACYAGWKVSFDAVGRDVHSWWNCAEMRGRD